jgi:hypothetical protein
MSLARQVALVALGAIIIAAAVIFWKYVTGAMTSLVENTWCTTIEKAAVCQFRGYQHFLIWTSIGITNLLILGLIVDRIGNRYRE